METKIIDKGPVFGTRHVQGLLIFFFAAIAYSTRIHITVAINAMTSQTSSNPDIPYFDWDNKSIILSAFFWGYIVPQLPGGLLMQKLGTKRILLVCMVLNSFFSMMIPSMAMQYGSTGVITCRVLQGLSQGVFYPGIHNLMGKWAVVEERSRMAVAPYVGILTGVIITLPLSGYICESSLGWPAVFYIFGCLGFVWAFSFYYFGAGSPASHSRITKEEKRYIEESLATTVGKDTAVPWKAIFTSVPVWTLIMMNLLQGWGIAIAVTEMPVVLDKVLHFDIESNGLLSAAPYLSNLIGSLCFGWLSDWLITKQYLTVTKARKLFTVIGCVGAAIFVFTFGFLSANAITWSVVTLIAQATARSPVSVGYMVNHIDLSPNFSGTLMGIINTAAEVFSIITPITIQYIVTDETNKGQWRIIYIIAGVMNLACAIIFGFFGSGECQYWNNVEQDNEIDKKEGDAELKEVLDQNPVGKPSQGLSK
ncbi:unnamed protein product [Phaedon cochleariae]|uniref:Putative inorganic phosphate cotransporter n=1 Tax=Phaedon cochleariae TaxID=80249 RepID=A0A9N9SLF8_PHACE|nr:unnamed protein product [Phaedon cochleariae]